MTKHPESLLIGAHTSAAGGVYNALLEGHRIGATTIQLFTANQRQWKAPILSPDVVAKWNETLQETGLRDIMSHDSYLINLGAPDPEILAKSRNAFKAEIQRCQALGVTYLNFHPGAATTASREQCLDLIIESLLEQESLVAKGKTRLLLEATAGQGSTVGCTFEELAYLVNGVKDKVAIGVCIDTCHIFAAGYDLTTAAACAQTFDRFDKIVGLKWLYALHLNDSKRELGSRVDRHEPLGEGKIGIECFKWLMNDPRTRKLPKYLETPGGPELWEKEIQLLRGFAEVHHREQ